MFIYTIFISLFWEMWVLPNNPMQKTIENVSVYISLIFSQDKFIEEESLGQGEKKHFVDFDTYHHTGLQKCCLLCFYSAQGYQRIGVCLTNHFALPICMMR